MRLSHIFFIQVNIMKVLRAKRGNQLEKQEIDTRSRGNNNGRASNIINLYSILRNLYALFQMCASFLHQRLSNAVFSGRKGVYELVFKTHGMICHRCKLYLQDKRRCKLNFGLHLKVCRHYKRVEMKRNWKREDQT